MMQKKMRKSAITLAYLSCVSLVALASGLSAEQVDLNTKFISVGSYAKETGFAPQVTGKVLCVAMVSSACDLSAVAELERELKARKSFDLVKSDKVRMSVSQLIVSAFGKPLVSPINIEAKADIFAESAFDLKIPTSKVVATVLRNEEEKAKPSFRFSNSYAFLK